MTIKLTKKTIYSICSVFFIGLIPIILIYSPKSFSQVELHNLVENDKQRFEAPMFMASTIINKQEWFYLIERSGKLYRFLNGKKITQKELLLDISNKVITHSEHGFLGLALDPGFSHNQKLYIYYSSTKAKQKNNKHFKTKKNGEYTLLSSFTQKNTALETAKSEVTIDSYSQPFSNHNGGMIAFGPDNYLYISPGDGGSFGDPRERAQDLKSPLGKMLRIDVSQNKKIIPSSNPFVGMNKKDPKIRADIWAIGIRNAWRFSFDFSDLWIADVGQFRHEEINLISKGGLNLGWDLYEASEKFENSKRQDVKDLTFPIFSYTRPEGFSITGGYVYRGKDLGANFIGKYIYGDYGTGKTWALSYDSVNKKVLSNEELKLAVNPISLVSFAVDKQGEIYILSMAGDIFKLQSK